MVRAGSCNSFPCNGFHISSCPARCGRFRPFPGDSMNKRWVFRRHEEPFWVGGGLEELSTWPRWGPSRGQFRARCCGRVWLCQAGRLLRDTKAAGRQVLTNGPSSLAGAISPTAVPERSLGCGAGCAPFRRRRSTDDGPVLAAACTVGGADPCWAMAPMTGTRAVAPVAPVSGSSWRSLRPGAIGTIDGHAWTLVRYPGAVDDPDAGEWISCRTRRNRLDRLRLQPCRHGPADPAPDKRAGCPDALRADGSYHPGNHLRRAVLGGHRRHIPPPARHHRNRVCADLIDSTLGPSALRELRRQLRRRVEG